MSAAEGVGDGGGRMLSEGAAPVPVSGVMRLFVLAPRPKEGRRLGVVRDAEGGDAAASAAAGELGASLSRLAESSASEICNDVASRIPVATRSMAVHAVRDSP